MLSLPFPPSVNNLYVNVPGKGRIKSPEYRQWLAEAGWLLKAQKPAKVEGAYRLAIIADRPDRRARDLDNLAKAVSDLLKKQGVITDDSHAQTLLLAWSDREPKKPGGVRVTVVAA